MGKFSPVTKTILILILVLIVGIGVWFIKINWFEAGSPLTTRYRTPDAAVRLNVQGEDLRVYEFTPEQKPDALCVFVAGTNKSGLFCMEK